MATESSTESLTPLQNAVYLLKQAQAKLAAYERARSEPIAVVGMGCRFPRADNPSAFWSLLSEGIDAIREVPGERWSLDEYYDPDVAAPGKMHTRWGGFLDRVDEFDADFFGISPREAVRVDPQHRLLLEVAWEALENAGIPPSSLAESRTGVYVGVIGNDYALLQSRDLTDMDVFSGTGVSHAVLANRLSYVFNLHGPSIALDTACSSSLVTVHLACRSLREGESDLALAGGVNLVLGPATTIALSKAAHDVAGWPLQGVRRFRRWLRAGRRLRPGRPEAAPRRPGRRRPHPGGGPRHGGQPRRPQQRAVRAERPCPRSRAPRGSAGRRLVPARHQLHRSAWDRHAAGRSN